MEASFTWTKPTRKPQMVGYDVDNNRILFIREEEGGGAKEDKDFNRR